jgi:hypothetical protein
MSDLTSLGYIRYKTLNDLFQKMVDIPYAVVKGEALSVALYGKPGCRNSNDVDILTTKKNVAIFEKELQLLGFKPLLEQGQNIREKRIFLMANSHQTVQYKKLVESVSVDVDVNFKIYWGEANIQEDMDLFLSDTEKIDIYGYAIKCLPLEKQLLHLCIHNYKDINSIYILLRRRKPIHFRIFNEIRLLLEKVHSLNRISQFIDAVNCLHAQSYVYYMLYYTNMIEKSDNISAILDLLKPYADTSIIDSYGLSPNERKLWPCSFKERYEVDDMMPFIMPDLNDDDIRKIRTNLKYYKNWRTGETYEKELQNDNIK